jgi:multidrug resistance efflux pump
MKSETLTPIPTPAAQKMRDFRARFLPGIVIALCVITIGVLWRNNIAATSLVGQAEPVLANLSSHLGGTVSGLNVIRFQHVRQGDVLGEVLVADPKLVAASLAVVRAEIEEFRLADSPLIRQQRNAVDYVQVRLDWMRQRAALATAKVNLQLAEIELRRNQDLLKDNLVSQSIFDLALATRDGAKGEVEELTRLVTEGEQSFKELDPTGDLVKLSGDPTRAALKLQEARLRRIEAELSPVTLRASIDGVITAVHFRSGESVTAGQPIISIASVQPVRIVGYMRSPDPGEPKVGTKVEVRSRVGKREIGIAQITEVGTQFEAPPLALASSANPPNTELGLPIEVSLPANLAIRPGELVDLILVTE